MAVKLRVQNPSDMALDYDGVALELELNNHRLKPVGWCCGLKVRIRVA